MKLIPSFGRHGGTIVAVRNVLFSGKPVHYCEDGAAVRGVPQRPDDVPIQLASVGKIRKLERNTAQKATIGAVAGPEFDDQSGIGTELVPRLLPTDHWPPFKPTMMMQLVGFGHPAGAGMAPMLPVPIRQWQLRIGAAGGGVIPDTDRQVGATGWG